MGRQRRSASHLTVYRDHHRRACRSDDGERKGGRGIDHTVGSDGSGGRHSSGARDATAVGRCYYGAHQSEFSVADLVPRVEQSRFANDNRRERR